MTAMRNARRYTTARELRESAQGLRNDAAELAGLLGGDCPLMHAMARSLRQQAQQADKLAAAIDGTPKASYSIGSRGLASLRQSVRV